MLRTFQSFDRDGSGKLDAKELLSALQMLHSEVKAAGVGGDEDEEEAVTEESVARFLRQHDLNNDGTIDFDEFLRAVELL